MKQSLPLALLCGIAALLAGCAGPSQYTQHTSVSVDTQVARPGSDHSQMPAGYPKLGGTTPGSLLSVEDHGNDLPRLRETGASVSVITYLSQTAQGQVDRVTALVAIPGGTPPDGGWPLMAYNHGNTGVNYNCGPSLYSDLMNQTLPVESFLENGYAVVASDYAGISGDPTSPGLAFLDAKSIGRDVLNGVRATRRVSPDISRRWAMAGGSLGGMATWGANSIVSDYPDLAKDLVAAAAWVPVVNIEGLVDAASSKTLTLDQRHLYFLTVLQLQRTTHPEIDLRQYMRGTFYDNRDLLTLCTGPRLNDAIKVLDDADPEDLVPSSPAAARAMKGYFRELQPRAGTTAPMVIVYGGQDKLVNYQWVEGAIDRSCRAGATIQWEKHPAEGHGDIQAGWVFSWIDGQFNGDKAINQCPQGPLVKDGAKAG